MTTYHKYPPQNTEEFECLCQIIREHQPVRILEIGSRRGRSLLRFSEAAMPSVQQVVSIELPGKAWGARNSLGCLEACVETLRRRGVDVQLHLLDSQGVEMANLLPTLGEFDFIFIDADHSLEGVTADFNRFYPLLLMAS